MASDEEGRLSSDENFEWNVENEIRLFEAMIGHKPVGINKHFHMACISEKFESLIGKPISSEVIWKHLETMFDLAALDKKEALPFPNDVEEFSLPESEYSELINEKILLKCEPFTDVKEISKEVRSTPKVLKDSTPAKESIKKERKTEEDPVGNSELDKKDTSEFESEGKKIKSVKEEKIVKTRAKRSTKDKKSEEETSQTTPSGIKKEEEEVSVLPISNKKEKPSAGKRTLRSRLEDLASNKSLTPPPIKRARRI